MDPRILRTNSLYFFKVLKYHGIKHTQVGPLSDLCYVDGFSQYNHLVNVNSIFSAEPAGDIIDRTFTIRQPYKVHVDRPWITPVDNLTFNDCAKDRVEELTANGQKVNLLWSGGIDSTAVIVSFLNHCKNLDQVRILYSTYSVKENPYFFLLLQEQPMELVDFSGDVYLEQDFDGIFVSGDGADDLHASIDKSFYDKFGYEPFNKSWKDFFAQSNNDPKFIEFCEEFFSVSTKPITTLLEARWWFYTTCKIHKFPLLISGIVQENQPLPVGFFDSYKFEHFMFHHIDQIMTKPDYTSYKQLLKDYIFEFDKNDYYHKNKTKTSSNQIGYYWRKKIHVNDQRYIMILNDGTRIRTENLPFLSEKEYRNTFGNTLDYLFN